MSMDELISLAGTHKWKKNAFRTNLDTDPAHWRIDPNGRRWIADPWAPYSNTVRKGPILECVQKMLPNITALCLNRKRAKSPPVSKHRDSKNSGPSYVCFWGDYDNSDGQGALCLEDGTVYTNKHTWHGPMEGSKIEPWVTPHEKGTRYSAVAFSAPDLPITTYGTGKASPTLPNA